MIASLSPNNILRLRNARDATIEALQGAVWVTEASCPGDACITAGGRYRIRSDGLVLVGTDADPRGGRAARVSVQHSGWAWARWFFAAMPQRLVQEWRARRTAHELGELSDHLLADIGLRRDQLYEPGRLERRL